MLKKLIENYKRIVSLFLAVLFCFYSTAILYVQAEAVETGIMQGEAIQGEAIQGEAIQEDTIEGNTIEENTTQENAVPPKPTSFGMGVPIFTSPVNPLAVDEDDEVIINLFEYFTEPDNLPLTFSIKEAPEYGNVKFDEVDANIITYKPNPNYDQSDKFTISAHNGTEATDGKFDIYIIPKEDAPIASNDSANCSDLLGGFVDIDVLGNDIVVDTGGELEIAEILTQPAHGTAVIPAADEYGKQFIRYTPETGKTGIFTFDYAVQHKGGSKTSTATVAVTVVSANKPPVFIPPVKAIEVEEDDTKMIDLTDYFTDPESQTLSFTIKTPPANGVISTIAAGILYYTPHANYDGSDSFTMIASDGELSTEGTFEIVIEPKEDAPVAVKDTATCTTVSGTYVDIDVLANDIVVDMVGQGGKLVIEDIIVFPAYGTATVETNEQGKQWIRYYPNPRQVGTFTLTYRVRHDGGTLLSTAEVDINVTHSHNAPFFAGLPLILIGTEEIPLIFNFTIHDFDVDIPPHDNIYLDISSDNPKILQNANINIIKSSPDNDTANYEVTLTFEPYANTSPSDGYGPLTLHVIAWDLQDTENKIEEFISVTVNPVNNAPKIQNLDPANGFTVLEDDFRIFTFEVYDPDMTWAGNEPSGYQFLAISDTTAVLGNSEENVKIEFLEKVGDYTARYQVTVKPIPNANTEQAKYSQNPVKLTLTVIDDGNASDTLDYFIEVEQVNDIPVAKDLIRTTDEDTAIVIGILDAGSDEDGDDTIVFDDTYTDSISEEGGIISISADGLTMTYIPRENYFGTDSFTYRIIDKAGAPSIPRKVDILINFVNDMPKFTLINDESVRYVTLEDEPITIVVEVDDVETLDENMDSLMLQVTCMLNQNLIDYYEVLPIDPLHKNRREIFIKPADNKNSYDNVYARFRFVLGDGDITTTHYIWLEITPENDLPKTTPLKLRFTEDKPLTITGAQLFSVCSDVDTLEDDVITIKEISVLPSHGTITKLSYDTNGNIDEIIYMPNQYYNGEDRIHFIVKDKVGEETGIGVVGVIELTGIEVNSIPELDPIADVIMKEDEEHKIKIRFYDPEMFHEYLIISINSDDETVLNKESFTYTYYNEGGRNTGIDLFIHPRSNQFKDSPGITVNFTVSDGQNSSTRTFNVIVEPVPDKPYTPTQYYEVRDSTTLYFEPLINCYDPDPEDKMILTSVDIHTDSPIDLNGKLTDLGNGLWSYISLPNVEGEVWLSYEVKDEGGLTSIGKIIINVTNSDVGATIDRLPNINAFAGMEIDTMTLVVRGVSPGRPYDLAVEILDGGPVDNISLRIDKGTSVKHIASATLPDPDINGQTHTLDFNLLKGVVGQSVVRVTITYLNDKGIVEEGSMSFLVLASSENSPPVAHDVFVTVAEGQTIKIDVLGKDHVEDLEDPNGTRLRIQSIDGIVKNGELHPIARGEGTADILREDGKWWLRYTAYSPYDARTRERTFVIQYTVVDSGGKTDFARAHITVISENHKPYTNQSVHIVTWDNALNGISLDVAKSGRDYDADTCYLADVWPNRSVSDINTFVGEMNHTTGQLEFKIIGTEPKAGWYQLHYTVRSQFLNDPLNEWDYSHNKCANCIISGIRDGECKCTGGVVLVGVRTKDGELPPRVLDTWYRLTEDGDGNGGYPEHQLTSVIFANKELKLDEKNNEVWVDMELDIQYISSTHHSKLPPGNITFRKEQVGNAWQYYIQALPVDNANESGGAPVVTYRVTQTHNGITTYDDGKVTVYITPLNDPPQITGQPSLIEMNRGDIKTFTVNVTDIDFDADFDGVFSTEEQELCDKQIELSLLSDNDLVVNSQLCTVTPPTKENPGIWTISIRGILADDCEISLIATDASGGTHKVVVPVSIDPENRKPVAEHYKAIFNEDTKGSVSVFNENSDPDGDPLTIKLVDDPFELAKLPGTVDISGDKIVFSPNADFCHSLIFDANTSDSDWMTDQYVEVRYILIDNHGGESLEGKVWFHFNPVNDPPRFIGVQSNHSMDEDIPGRITLKVIDIDSDFLTFSTQHTDMKIEKIDIEDNKVGISGGTGCEYDVTLHITNVLHQYHNFNLLPPDEPSQITVIAYDDTLLEAETQLFLTIEPTNDTPVLAKPVYTDPDSGAIMVVSGGDARLEVDEDDEDFFIDLPAYYFDQDGDVIRIISLSNPENGTVVIDNNRANFIPSPDYFTKDPNNLAEYGKFDYAITDGFTSVSGTVYIFIRPVNDAPRPRAANRTTPEDIPLEIDLFEGTVYNSSSIIWDVDNKKEELSVISVRSSLNGEKNKTEQGGTLVLASDGKVIYTPPFDFFGTDRFVFEVSDEGGNLPGEDKTDTAVITITVTAVNDKPRANFENSTSWVAFPATCPAMDESEIVIWEFDEDIPSDFQFRVWDPEFRNLIVDYASNAPNSLLPKENITHSGTGENLVLHMKPLENQHGTFTLTFTINDGVLDSIFTVEVRIRSVNDLPEIAPQSISVNEDSSYTTGKITATDVENKANELEFSLANEPAYPPPAHGTATVTAMGNFTYTPNPDYFGYDEFFIKVTDKDDGFSYAKISVTVIPINDAPSAPTNITLDEAHYRGGEEIYVTWTAGEDLVGETLRENLLYEIELFNGSTWLPMPSLTNGNVEKDNNYLCTYTIPKTYTAGINYEEVKVRIRTRDDGRCYLNGEMHATLGFHASAYAVSDAVKFDSTSPTATHTLQAPGLQEHGWTNQNIIITIIPSDGTAAWQSGVKEIDMVTTSHITDLGNYQYEISRNNEPGYEFILRDNVGNTETYYVEITHIDRIHPTIIVDPTNIDFADGYYITNAPVITIEYNDPVDVSGNDLVSGLKEKRYELVRAGETRKGWKLFEDNKPINEVKFPLKGIYTLYVCAVDYAGNVYAEKPFVITNYGLYEIENSPPIPKTLSGTVYEHTVAVAGISHVLNIQLDATDADIEDVLSYEWEQDNEYDRLISVGGKMEQLGAAGSGTYKFTYEGDEVESISEGERTFTLTFKVEDNHDPIVAVAYGTYTLTLVPVNHRPDPPSNIIPASNVYKENDNIDLSWTGGKDIEHALKNTTQLSYDLEYTLDGTNWIPIQEKYVGESITIPAPAGNTNNFQFRVRSNDGNTAYVDEITGTKINGRSPWVLSPKHKLDNTAPNASHNIVSNVWTNQPVTITITANDGGQEWQSGFDRIEQVSTDYITNTSIAGNVYTYVVDRNGIYSFTLIDKKGNERAYSVKVDKIDRMNPYVEAVEPSITLAQEIYFAMNPFVTLTYMDLDDNTGRGDNKSKLKLRQFELVDVTTTPTGDWTTATEDITKVFFPKKGTFDLYVRAEDHAGNVFTYQYGPYEISNSAPVADDTLAGTVYEHTAGSYKHTIDIQLEAEDKDIEDTLSYEWLTTDSEYIRLLEWGDMVLTGAMGSGTYTFTVKDKEIETLLPVSERTFTLPFRAVDDHTPKSGSDIGTYTLTLEPVNHRPEIPSDVTTEDAAVSSKEVYKQGDSVKIDWTDGEDKELLLLGETLKYDIQYTLNGTDWKDIVLEHGTTSYTFTAPAGDTDTFKVRVRSNDGNIDFIDEITGTVIKGVSEWVESPDYKLDNTAPKIKVDYEQDIWKNDEERVIVSITDSGSGATGINEISGGIVTPVHLPADTESWKEERTATLNDTVYTYTVTDHAGNTYTEIIVVDNIDTFKPKVKADPPMSILAGTFHQPIYVELEYYDEEAVFGESGKSNITKDKYMYRTYTIGTPDDKKPAFSQYKDKIIFDARNLYYIEAYCTDIAGNVGDIHLFGPYEITNGEPEVQDMLVTLYEHEVDGLGDRNTTFTLTATDPDDDGVNFIWVEDAEYNGLAANELTLTKGEKPTDKSEQWTLTYTGTSLPPLGKTVTLTYYARDDYEDYVKESTKAKVEIILMPVNDPPSKPTNFTITPQTAPLTEPYKGGQTIRLSWNTSTDEETNDADLTYVVGYRDHAVTSVSHTWTTDETAANVTQHDFIIPLSTNTASLEFFVQAKDDNVTTINQDASYGSGLSEKAVITDVKVDTTVPTAGHTLTTAGRIFTDIDWTNQDVVIALTPNKGSEAWQSDIADVTVVGTMAGTGHIIKGDIVNGIHYYTVNAVGIYEFSITDKSGNNSTYSVEIKRIDKDAPTVIAMPASYPAGENKVATDNSEVILQYHDPWATPALYDLSDLAKSQYKLVKNGVEPNSWSDYTEKIILNKKGNYEIYARVTDKAGNEVNEIFGPYVIHNSAPVPTSLSGMVYEHSITATGEKHTIDIILAATDADGDVLTFAWVEDAEYHRLVNNWGSMELTGKAGSGKYRFTHNGAETETLSLTERVFSLKYEVKDDNVPAAGTVGEYTLTLVPVNDKPSKPIAIVPASWYYKVGETITLKWGASTDAEGASLTYKVEYTLDGSTWIPTPNQPLDSHEILFTTPGGNTDKLQFRVNANDGNAKFIDEKTGMIEHGLSQWAYSPVHKLDNTPPTATASKTAKDDVDGKVFITVYPTDGSETWQTGIDRVEVDIADVLKVTEVDKDIYEYQVAEDGTYRFWIYDKAGNKEFIDVIVSIPDDVTIFYNDTHTRIGNIVPVSWTAAATATRYQLQVFDGNAWSTVSPTIDTTEFDYEVPAGFPDTLGMKFRVRAINSEGLHSANWSDDDGDILCDSTKPTIIFTPHVSGNDFTNQSYDVEVTVLDLLSQLADVKVNQDHETNMLSPYSSIAFSHTETHTFIENGKLIVIARDVCGNESTKEYDVINIDKLPPSVSVDVKLNGTSTTAANVTTISFAMSFSDTGVSGLAERLYAITNTDEKPVSGWKVVDTDEYIHIQLVKGVYFLHKLAIDKAGNQAYEVVGPFEINNTAPNAKGQTVTINTGDAIEILLEAEDIDQNDSITRWEIISDVRYGILTDLGNGKFHYENNGENPEIDKTDFFTFVVEDARDAVSNIARVDIVINKAEEDNRNTDQQDINVIDPPSPPDPLPPQDDEDSPDGIKNDDAKTDGAQTDGVEKDRAKSDEAQIFETQSNKIHVTAPQTSDKSNVELWWIMLLISVLGVAILAIWRREWKSDMYRKE